MGAGVEVVCVAGAGVEVVCVAGAGVEVVCVVGAGVEVVCVEIVCVEIAACVDVTACVGAAVVDVTGGVGAAVEVAGGVAVVAVGAEAGAEEPAVLLCLALGCLTLWVLFVFLGVAAGSAALVAADVVVVNRVAVEVVAGAEALVAVEELDPQPATARQARTSPQLARHLSDPVMAVTISVFQFCRGGERSV